jgi:diaminobutyrate-2-oxoglutarate transaminase
VQAGMLERGVMLEVGGRDDAVVRMLPPLIISEAEVDMVVEVFADVLAGIPPA